MQILFNRCGWSGVYLYSEEGDFVKITFYFQCEKNVEKSDEDNILELAKIKNEITIADIINQLDISRNTATRKINTLVQQNKIARTGKGPSTKFKTTVPGK